MQFETLSHSQFKSLDRLQGASMLCEIAWEICRQMGGIYTVIRSKVPSMVEAWGDDYLLVGPYEPKESAAEFTELDPEGPIAEVINKLREEGIDVHYGYWMVSGKPKTLLLNPHSVMHKLGDIKYFFWQNHHIEFKNHDPLMDEVLAFGYTVERMMVHLAPLMNGNRKLLAHFHEWMAGTSIPEIRRQDLPVRTIFTTHATLLGRYLAANDPNFYGNLPFVDWEAESNRMNIAAPVRLERAAAHGANIFTTVSKVTAEECRQLLGRDPDVLLPNGLNIERFVNLHEFQTLHLLYKQKINEFVMSHFFPSYKFDLNNTLYFFSSGRYEYRNKGFDMTLEALSRLNQRMVQNQIDKTVVFFLITRRPNRSYLTNVMQSRGTMEEMRNVCEDIQKQIGDRLFEHTARGEWPDLNTLIDEHSRMRLRRIMHAWSTDKLPPVVTHQIENEGDDEVLQMLRHCNMVNNQHDKVKIVYHPDFVSSTQHMLGLDYDQFVRGCHLGVFPSAYEPWGYTPLECLARGIPAVTSDLSGFGAYLLDDYDDNADKDKGLHIVRRRQNSYDGAATILADWLFNFCQQSRRERVAQRNDCEELATHFDWRNLGHNYTEAYRRALEIE